MVVLSFQEAVAEGRADWRVNDDDETEISMDTGEIFVLHEGGVTRLA